MLDSAYWSNDSFVDALAAFDELLGAYGPSSRQVANVAFDFAPLNQRSRLHRCAECLKILEEVWPGSRRSEKDPGLARRMPEPFFMSGNWTFRSLFAG